MRDSSYNLLDETKKERYRIHQIWCKGEEKRMEEYTKKLLEEVDKESY